jgi:hypothetical protein
LPRSTPSVPSQLCRYCTAACIPVKNFSVIVNTVTFIDVLSGLIGVAYDIFDARRARAVSFCGSAVPIAHVATLRSASICGPTYRMAFSWQPRSVGSLELFAAAAVLSNCLGVRYFCHCWFGWRVPGVNGQVEAFEQLSHENASLKLWPVPLVDHAIRNPFFV